MTRTEARRMAYAVVAMIIQDSDAYNLIKRWAKDEQEVTQLHEALTEVRDLIEQRAGMNNQDSNAERAGDETADIEPHTSNLFVENEPLIEGESK